MKFGEYLTELAFKKNVDWMWKPGKKYKEAFFSVGGNDFTARIELMMPSDVIFHWSEIDPTEDFSDDAWYFNFVLEDGSVFGHFDITGTGNWMAVFSTINEIMDDWLRNRKPKAFAFSAAEPSKAKIV